MEAFAGVRVYALFCMVVEPGDFPQKDFPQTYTVKGIGSSWMNESGEGQSFTITIPATTQLQGWGSDWGAFDNVGKKYCASLPVELENRCHTNCFTLDQYAEFKLVNSAQDEHYFRVYLRNRSMLDSKDGNMWIGGDGGLLESEICGTKDGSPCNSTPADVPNLGSQAGYVVNQNWWYRIFIRTPENWRSM